jgi:thioester reductase-like protein
MDLFLTGATGAVGGDLLRRLLGARQNSTVYVLVRASGEDELRMRSLPILANVNSEHACRVIPVAGDIMRSDLGLGAAQPGWISQIGEIYHVAACTSFCQSMEQANRTNLAGTKHIIDFARSVRKTGASVRLHHVSTAYVSGTRTGNLRENELESGQEFFNYYEWSKFEAERLVRAASDELPVAVYRPGIIVGDSRTGHTSRFHGIYQILRGIHYGLIDSLPCQPDFQLDITPVDYVSNAIIQLAQLSGSANKTFHLTAGPGNTMSLRELVDIYLREGTACEGSKCRPGSLRFLPFLNGSAEVNRETPQAWRRFSHYLPYVTCPKTFDNSVTRAMLPDSKAPDCREYLPNVVRYALESGFA